MVECCNSLAKYLEDQGPKKAMDVDELLLRESMDVIGESSRDLTNFPSAAKEVRALVATLWLALLFQLLSCMALQCTWVVLQGSMSRVLSKQAVTSARSAFTCYGMSLLLAWACSCGTSLKGQSAAGRFGFQKDMNAIASLYNPASEANHNVRALLGSTEEVVERTKTFCRWFQLWRAEARHGWTILGRFKVRPLRCLPRTGSPLLHMKERSRNCAAGPHGRLSLCFRDALM